MADHFSLCNWGHIGHRLQPGLHSIYCGTACTQWAQDEEVSDKDGQFCICYDNVS